MIKVKYFFENNIKAYIFAKNTMLYEDYKLDNVVYSKSDISI
jgi:hypothetical protein